MILAIDPGQLQSGWCLFDGERVVESGIADNADIRRLMSDVALKHGDQVLLAVEMVASYGMPVGKEVFETVLWVGRFIERWTGPHRLVYRKEVKLHLCGTYKAKDPNIRQALIDRLGPVGTKKARGPLYGVKSHIWSAVAVAVTAGAPA